MSMCAAHRAALAVHHLDVEYDPHRKGNGANGRDLDYCIMKAKCIREMNVKVRDPKQALSDEAFDTIVNLLTGSVRFCSISMGSADFTSETNSSILCSWVVDCRVIR